MAVNTVIVLGILALPWVYTPLFPLKSEQVAYWPQSEVLAVPGPGVQLFNLSRCLGEACGNLAVHKRGIIFLPCWNLSTTVVMEVSDYRVIQ